MTKQKAHTLPIMRPPTRLRQRRTNIHSDQSRTPLLLLLMRYRIRDHDFGQLTAIERFDGLAAQNPMRDDGHDLLGSVRHHGVRGLDEGTAGVGHVVDDDGDFAADVADEDHSADFVGPRAFFVDEGEGEVEAVRYGGCSRENGWYSGVHSTVLVLDIPLGPSGIRTNNDGLLYIQICPDPPQGTWLRVEVVDGYIEETLDLTRVQIHRDDMVTTSRLQHIGHELGRYGRTRLVLFVLTCVREVGYDCCDTPRRCGFAG